MEQKLKVCAYCRVSTDKNDQLNSLVNQKHYFEEYIKNHENWILVSIFADEGITGTSTKNRTEFNKMISLAMEGKIDYIITKEVSRFSRNTVDVLRFTRELKQHNVGVKFINDNIDTLSDEGEFKLTLLSSLAQEESRKISSRVKWGQERQMEKGVVFGSGIYGYFLKNGALSINNEESETVKIIFAKFLEGKGTQSIATELNIKGIRPKKSNEWNSTAILKILRNEKYCGDLLQKKYVTPDFLEHKKIINKDQNSKILIKNHHDAIISREEWILVQKELLRRSPSEEIKNKHSNRYWCSGKVFCGICGKSFVGYSGKSGKGAHNKGWRCSQNALHGSLKKNIYDENIGCNNKIVSDKILKYCVNYIVESININKEKLIQQMICEINSIKNFSSSIDSQDIEKKISVLTDKKDNAINSMLEGIITKEDLLRITDKLNSQIEKLNRQINEINNLQEVKNKQVDTIAIYIKRLNEMLYLSDTQDNNSILKNITEKIIVYPDKSLVIKLKAIPKPYYIKYSCKGKGDSYKIDIIAFSFYDENSNNN